jgi:hypothetical protein
MSGVFVYVINHLENLENWVSRTLEVLLENSFVPPHPYVPTSHHKNCYPLLILNTMQLVIDILEDSFPAIKREKN